MFKQPLPHDEVAELASFRKAFASAMQKAEPFCSPPATKTESAESLAAQVDSGQAGGTTHQFLGKSSVLTKTHLKPAGALPGSVASSSWLDFAQSFRSLSSFLSVVNTSHAARMSPQTASTTIPQNRILLTDITLVSQFSSGFADCGIALGQVDSGQAVGTIPLKPVNTFGHISSPVGGWFQICGGRCFTLLAAYRHCDIARARQA